MTSVTLTGIQNHSGAAISNDQGPVLMSGEAPVGPWAGQFEINIDLTAEDGSTTKRYTVTTQRILTVNCDSAAYSVNEGGSVQVSVSLDGVPGNQVRADLSTTLQGGATTADFGGVPEHVTFVGTEVVTTFDFVARTDIPSDPGESVTIGLSPNSMLPGLANGSMDETVVSIVDIVTDQLVAVDFGQSTYSVDEGASVDITIKLATAPTGSVNIPLTITPDGATSSEYSVPSSVTFDSGETSQTITYSATLDADIDPGERVKIELGTLPTGYAAGAMTETTVSINNFSVVVNFGAASYVVTEDAANADGEIQISVTLSPALGSDVTVELRATGQGGATAADYSLPNPASVTFTAGQTHQTFTFTSKKDGVDDDGERVKIVFDALPAGVSAGAIGETTVNITDNDHPQVSLGFENGTYAVVEGQSIGLKMKLTAKPERSLTFIVRANLVVDDPASGDDFSGIPSNVHFAADATEAILTFAPTNDAVNEDDENVKLEPDLTQLHSVGLGDNFFTIVKIIDNDGPDVTVSFDESSYTVAESDDPDTSTAQENVVTFKVTLSADPDRTVAIPVYATVQNGVSSTDDYSLSPTVSTTQATPTILTFNAGDTAKSFTFSATDDALNDDGESVLLSIGSALPTGVTLGTHRQATVSIIDDDYPPVTVSFEDAAYSVAEGGSISVNVKLSGDPEQTVTIPINATAGLTGTSAVFSVPTDVTFASGETSKPLAFTSSQDDLDNDGETVKLSFRSLPDGVTAAGTTEALVSITDDDVPEVTVSFDTNTYTVDESDDPNTMDVKENEAMATVSLSADPERTVTIQLSKTSKDGIDIGDYSGVPSDLVFNSGDTVKSFTFTAVDDSDNDDGERLLLALTPLSSPGVTTLPPFAAQFNITDDDDPQVEVSFISSQTTVVEGATATITVSLDADPEREVIIPITKTHQGGALENDDYSGIPDTVTFTDGGPTTQSFPFQAVDDADDDDGESVTFGFGMLDMLPGVTAGTANDVTISITDDDDPVVNVYFEHDTVQCHRELKRDRQAEAERRR